jgi:hypothetical protein
MISPQDREICSVDFLSYGYSAMIGGVPLFYFKKKEDSNYGKEKSQNK